MTGGNHSRVLQHERAAREERCWVRLTRACNNHCAFCLDDLAGEQTMMPKEAVLEQMARGRARGATRLILSGGEPTIHPRFVGFIRAGREAGYDHIQVVTNGRMLAYPRLLRRCIEAGLNEVTLSVHGPDAAMHDELVGVPGAFQQTMTALRQALASPLVVSVDVCINRVNVGRLPELLERLWAMGVTEFDLLQVIPFGRAYRDDGDRLAYDMEAARPQLQRVLEISRRPGIHIWFNRFPPPYLEGHEHLIQDPHKLHDEVRGRQEELEALVTTGQPLRCRQPARCALCYLNLLCDTLEQTLAALEREDFDVYRVDAGGPPPPWAFEHVWLRGRDVASAAQALEGLKVREVTLELARYDGLEDDLEDGRLAGARVRGARVSRPADLEALLNYTDDLEVVAYLSRPMAAHLLSVWPRPPARLTLARRDHATAADAREHDADLVAFFSAYPAAAAVEGVPRCISGQAPRPAPRVLDAAVLRRGEGGVRLDLSGFTEQFIVEHYLSKSLRCDSCRWDGECPGVQLNYLRAHGYAALQPPDGG